MNYHHHGVSLEKICDSALALADIVVGKTAVNIGADSGILLNSLIQNGLNTITVDRSMSTLEEIKKRWGNFCNFSGCIGEPHNIPIDDAYADYVFANMILHHSEQPPLAIREMQRILKPEGRLVIVDLDKHACTALQQNEHDLWLGFDRNDVIQWCLKAGFKMIFVDSLEEKYCIERLNDHDHHAIGMFTA
ncbi:MAG: class I SAM-dependent methyltransferase, partial [candidate division WOR-3 bacterium]